MAAKNSVSAPGGEIGRQISAKSMGFDKAEILTLVINDKTSDHFLYRVTGVGTGLKPYKIKEGEKAGEIAFGIQGQFEGVTLDGVVLNGSVLYLPGYANDMVVAALSMPEAVGVKIAMDVYARFDEKSATSYVFTVRDLLNEGAAGVEEVKAQIQALPMPPKVLALPKE